MGLSRTVSETSGDFSRKSQNFPYPRAFCAPAEGVPLSWVPALEIKKLEWWGYRVEKEV